MAPRTKKRRLFACYEDYGCKQSFDTQTGLTMHQNKCEVVKRAMEETAAASKSSAAAIIAAASKKRADLAELLRKQSRSAINSPRVARGGVSKRPRREGDVDVARRDSRERLPSGPKESAAAPATSEVSAVSEPAQVPFTERREGGGDDINWDALSVRLSVHFAVIINH